MISFDKKSWVANAQGSIFPIQNLPYGIFSTAQKTPRMGVAIGDKILDLYELALHQLIDLNPEIANQNSINSFMALGKEKTNAIRLQIASLLEMGNDVLTNHSNKSDFFVEMNQATLHLPIKIGDYTDFYSSRQHATNVGIMFRDPANALLPNWLHIPVGYHGRASSIVVSGTPFHRPKGQIKPVESEPPIYSESKRMDFELEVGFVVGQATELGQTVSTKDAEKYIFGLFLFNDLSARDIQQWEYVPLGPFLGKNFASVASPWVVPIEAFDAFRVAGEDQNPKVLPYLEFEGAKNYNIELEVAIAPENQEETVICRSNFKYMYWNMCQQLAHHTVNGCNLNVGDVMASGTISGPEPHEFGSMLELAWKGTKPIQLKDGTERVFLKDNDTCIMRGFAKKDGVTIGFGDCTTKVLPAKN
jgi:fumarylacetoacetase